MMVLTARQPQAHRHCRAQEAVGRRQRRARHRQVGLADNGGAQRVQGAGEPADLGHESH